MLIKIGNTHYNIKVEVKDKEVDSARMTTDQSQENYLQLFPWCTS
jgi:hypothetical protein